MYADGGQGGDDRDTGYLCFVRQESGGRQLLQLLLSIDTTQLCEQKLDFWWKRPFREWFEVTPVTAMD